MGRPLPIVPPASSSTDARCEYCGRYGALGQCAGCGAPNVPTERYEQIDVTCFGDTKRRYVDGLPIPRFDKVRK